MVMVITFLMLTNIALGYGLAVYVQKNFGTLIYRRRAKAVAEVAATVETPAVAVAAASVAERAPTPEPAPVAAPAPQPVVAEVTAAPVPSEVAEVTTEAEAAVEVKAESDTVDEENVLAGIEEFRSQLAKMSEAAEQPASVPQQGLATAVN